MYDCLLISLPFTTDTNFPLLGLNILRAYASEKSLNVRIIDLNKLYLKELNIDLGLNVNYTGKYNEFIESLQLPDISKDRIPSCLSTFSSFPFDFDEIDSILDKLINNSFWSDFINDNILKQYSDVKVIGMSIMGPSQVLFALLLGKMVKDKYKHKIIIAGGTHVTLLKDKIKQNTRYSKYIDYFFYGHCESAFSGFLEQVKKNKEDDLKVNIGHYLNYCKEYDNILSLDRLPPDYDLDELNAIDENRIVIPFQLHRGCSYGKCNYCTFNQVETVEKKDSYGAIMEKNLKSLTHKFKVNRVSLRDSYISFNNAIKIGNIINNNCSAIWRFSTITNQNISVPVIEELHNLGCRVVELGVETIHRHTQLNASKCQDIKKVERLINTLADNGMLVQLNLIYGFVNESLDDAMIQLEWYHKMIEKYPANIYGSMFMLEINEKSNYQKFPEKYGIKLNGVGPWSSNYCWNAPAWRDKFHKKNLSNFKNSAFDRINFDKLLLI